MDGSRSSDDKVFRAAGPDVENARGPNVDVSVLGTTNWLSSADRSRDRPKTVIYCDYAADFRYTHSSVLAML